VFAGGYVEVQNKNVSADAVASVTFTVNYHRNCTNVSNVHSVVVARKDTIPSPLCQVIHTTNGACTTNPACQCVPDKYRPHLHFYTATHNLSEREGETWQIQATLFNKERFHTTVDLFGPAEGIR
jgi:hypothetical protein